MIDIKQCIFPIYSERETVGQGFIADGYFITAAHLVRDYPSCYVVLKEKRFELSKETPVYMGGGDIYHDEMMMDVVVYTCGEIASPLCLSEYSPQKGNEFNSLCIQETPITFSLEIRNSQTPSFLLSVERAIVTGIEEGNYFYCHCKRFAGSSGSPLLKGNEVVGIMHGGDDNGLCAFLKAKVIYKIIQIEKLSTKVTEQDRVNAWRGVKGLLYSEDRKRLLAVSEKNISRYKIKEGTKVICDFAFDACRYLEEIIIPNTVVRLGKRSFSGCSVDMKEIVIPNSVIEIGAEAFSDCNNLESIQLPLHIKKISKKCFASCVSLESIIIPHEVQEIEEFSFFCCKKLTTITFTSTIRKIGDSVFYGCDNLKAINIPIGSKSKFETLLPDYKNKLIEQEDGWTVKKSICFDAEEIAAIAYAEVIATDNGKCVCFFMMSGGRTYIPLIESSKLSVGDPIDLTKIRIITLSNGNTEKRRIVELDSANYDGTRNVEEQKLHSIKKGNNHFHFLDSHQYNISDIKPDAELIARYLNNNFQEYLYHFTHKENLEQIKEMGGLYSWVQLEKLGKPCRHPGGNTLSRELDTRYGVADYVHLSFSYKHPMSYKNDDDIVILRIHPIVCLFPDTLFCNMNATDKKHSIGSTYKDLVNITMWTTKMGYLESGTRLFKEKQAEVLVKNHIPLKYIVNINMAR